MTTILEVLIAAGLLFCVQTVAAEETDFTVQQLTDHIFELSYPADGYVVKVLVSVGVDGILLVDTGHSDKAKALKAKLRELWHGEPKVIVLSHEHIEHIGGAEVFGTDPVVIGHASLRSVLKSRYFLFEEYTEATLPQITFRDSLSLFFNGEEIRLVSVAGGHSGSDIIVWFVGSKVAYVHALCNWPHFPSIDNTTGNVLQYPDAVKQVIDMLPEDTRIVSGHGSDCSMTEFRQFHTMLTQTTEIVKRGLAEGKTLETLQKEDVLKDFKSYEGSYTSADEWIKYLVKGFQGTARDGRTPLYEPLYFALKDKGLDGALAYYGELKRDHPDEYKFDETTLPIIGMLLSNHGQYTDAIGFLRLGLQEYPQGAYTSLSYKVLGEAYERTNDIKQALENYRKVVKLEPSDSTTVAKIRQLENK